MSLTDLSGGTDTATMTAQEPGPRSGRPRRRTFSAAYKLRILTAYDEATAPSECGALLRAAYNTHPHRSGSMPLPPPLPETVHINPPRPHNEEGAPDLGKPAA